jgi:ribosomal protein S17
MASEIEVGDYIEIKECRPISKIISFVVVDKVSGEDEDKKSDKGKSDDGGDE